MMMVSYLQKHDFHVVPGEPLVAQKAYNPIGTAQFSNIKIEHGSFFFKF
jgi:hypothetical protein